MGLTERIDGIDWTGAVSTALSDRALDALEQGAVLRLALPFELAASEARLLREGVLSGKRKNASYDPRSGQVKGAADDPALRDALLSACARYHRLTRDLAVRLFPPYRDALADGRTSFRPAEVSGRVPKSPRKDDSRLHVDAFPATPVQGRRMLRFFSNVNPEGATRHWQVGEPFPQVAQRFLPRVPAYSPLVARALAALRVTKSVRSAYDHCMLHIHDDMKCDADYQRSAVHEDVHFAAGETWIVFTDQVSHAALAGRFMFEQTYYLPVAAQRFPDRSPLRVLERLSGRTLV
ncbi:MAG: Kdo hydroxylase family protein [Gemmatimonadota bacterium]